MAIPYPFVTNNKNHFNTGSYLNEQETKLFVSGYGMELWYGFAETDVVELSLFDLNQNQIGWDTIETDKEFRTITLSYIDTFNKVVSYSYNELLSDLILYKNTKILVNPANQISASFGVTNGSYQVSYNFVREMAGSPSASLLIKDISPSRREVKITPATGNPARYEAFCRKKLLIKDVAPLLLQLTNQCPYDQIYSQIKDQYTDEVTFLKNLLFLNTDGALMAFLKTLYEDVNTFSSTKTALGSSTQIKRTQGIKTYFQNNLLSNYETISDWDAINKAFIDFTTYRINVQFQHYGANIGQDFTDAKQFLVDFFTTFFYTPVSTPARNDFQSKYYTYFKNVVNFGHNNTSIIIDHTVIDERVSPTDPLTLVVKLKSELGTDIKIQDPCWISNYSIAPFLVNVIIRSSFGIQTIKIGPPNFSLGSDDVSLYNVNKSYSAADLRNSAQDQQALRVSRNLSKLKVDYTDFTNFVIYSSAGQRLSNFKTKISTYYNLSSSLITLNTAATDAAASGSSYPLYIKEQGSIDAQMTDIVNSFDGYETYLFDSGSYQYNSILGQFINASYVTSQDISASFYDKQNRDSLINCSPEHIVMDEENEEYLMFLAMIGHFFDNIYLYINNLPTQKIVTNDPTTTLTKAMIDNMLEEFGWAPSNTYEDLTVQEAYLTSVSSSLSAEDRTKAIRTRILTTLPQIYKTKGTEEAINLLLACHGIPTEILSVREYGNEDYVTSSLVTYTKPERFLMLNLSGSTEGYSTQIDQNFALRPLPVRTFETKIKIDQKSEIYPRMNVVPIAQMTHDYFAAWDINWTYHTFFPFLTASYQALGHYPFVKAFPAWEIGFWRETDNLGRFYARIAQWNSSSSELPAASSSLSQSIDFTNTVVFLSSSLLPIFDGEVFNIRLRRNYPDPAYIQAVDENLMPLAYDLTVQRNEAGRQVWRSFSSKVGEYETNKVWYGSSIRSQFEQTGSFTDGTISDIVIGGIGPNLYNYSYWIGNTMVWDVPISDEDFELHCNDFSSFAYSGSDGFLHLITRIDEEEPLHFFDSRSFWQDGSNLGMGSIPNHSEYYSTFDDLYSSVIDSGSWIGNKTGSLKAVEDFTGSSRAIYLGSILSGTGVGTFVSNSFWEGQINSTSGSSFMSGTFNGLSIGRITSSAPHTYGQSFGQGNWSGSAIINDGINNFTWVGTFVGYASGTFFSPTFGQMTSPSFGTYSGRRTDVWSGVLTGSITGSFLGSYMSGSFFGGYGSGSGLIFTVAPIGNISGSYYGIWFGEMDTGSFNGSFTGSSGRVAVTGSTEGQLAYYSGSFKGSVSGSFDGYGVGYFSGSFLQDWTGSQMDLYGKTPMPQSITYLSYNPPLNASYSSSISCSGIVVSTQSAFPYEYDVMTVDKTFTTPKYGPNRFKNEKVKKMVQEVETRLDDRSRSTTDLMTGIRSDSNLIGLYLDPQDAKNREIQKYMGRWDVMDAIADPQLQYSSSYTALQGLNKTYNSFGDRRVLYNELISLYKIYFNRSIFDSFESLVPARTAVRRGILVEPTVLERPKYQRRPTFSEMNTGSVFYAEVTASHYFRDLHTKLVRFAGAKSNESAGKLGLLFADFNIQTASISVSSFNTGSLPANPTIELDFGYLNEANFIYPQNYNRGQYNDLPDEFQFGDYGSLGVGVNGVVQASGFSDSAGGVLVKQWDKYTIYAKSGSYVRDSIKGNNVYQSQSVWLWKLVTMTPSYYSTLFFTSSLYVRSSSLGDLAADTDVLLVGGQVFYFHRINTAISTDNQNTNNLRPTDNHIGHTYVVASAPYSDISEKTFFEAFGGYPRQHYTHRLQTFSPNKYVSFIGPFAMETQKIIIKGSQTIDTTIDNITGIEDASPPVQSITTTNINLVQSDNVINQ